MSMLNQCIGVWMWILWVVITIEETKFSTTSVCLRLRWKKIKIKKIKLKVFSLHNLLKFSFSPAIYFCFYCNCNKHNQWFPYLLIISTSITSSLFFFHFFFYRVRVFSRYTDRAFLAHSPLSLTLFSFTSFTTSSFLNCISCDQYFLKQF